MPVAQSTLVSSHWANETEAMPLPESVAVAVIVSGSAEEALM